MKPHFQIDEIERRWRESGFGCQAHTDAPFQEWRDLADARDEMVHVLSGRLEVVVEGELHVLRAGDEILIRANALHSSTAGSQSVALLYGYKETQMLANEQIESFERDGFLVLPQVLRGETLSEIQEAARKLAQSEPPQIGFRVWHERALFRRAAFRRVFECRELIEAQTALLGEDVQMLALDLLMTRPQNGGVGWHRDVNFVCNKTLSINSGVYLQDMTAEFGPLRVVPGSHRWEENPSQNPDGVLEVPTCAGDAVLFDAGLWHAGNLNNSTQDRLGLFAYFGKYWIKRMDNFFTQPLPQSLAQTREPLQRQLLGLGLREGVASYHGDDESYNRRGEAGIDFCDA